MLYDEEEKKGSEQNQRNCSKCKYGGKTATGPEGQKSRHTWNTLLRGRRDWRAPNPNLWGTLGNALAEEGGRFYENAVSREAGAWERVSRDNSRTLGDLRTRYNHVITSYDQGNTHPVGRSTWERDDPSRVSHRSVEVVMGLTNAFSKA
jgi:hypothetical protein